MNKVKIEIERWHNHISGYGMLQTISSESQFILDKLIEWSKENSNYTIYRHYTMYEEENFSEPQYMFDGRLGSMKARICDYVCYLYIYYQEK